MGRKGIGKLSLFSIADEIEIQSVKLDTSETTMERRGFIMNSEEIKKVIKTGKQPYRPTPLGEKKVKVKKGTRIILRNLRKGVRTTTEKFLRTRIARRFSVISDEFKFAVKVNGKPITLNDRNYFKAIQYLWHIGEGSEKYIKYCSNSEKQEKVSGVVDEVNNFKLAVGLEQLMNKKILRRGTIRYQFFHGAS
ncbi:MAG: hypothetical protein IPO22_15450 [Anaerolineales bacterium]|nr:hypothetical protein [Anaerolineales bacterium]